MTTRKQQGNTAPTAASKLNVKQIDRLLKLRSIHENWEIKEKRFKFRDEFYTLLEEWDGGIPKLQDVFQKKVIDWLLIQSVNYQYGEKNFQNGERFINLIARMDYKDEPSANEVITKLALRTTPLHYLFRNWLPHRKYVAQDLFQIYNRFDLNYIDEFGRTHFHAACAYGLHEIVEKFLNHDFNPTNYVNSPLDWLVPETKDSPLHLAVENGHMNVAILLMQKGASPNLGNDNGLTYLHVICKKNYSVPIPESKNIDDVLKIFFKTTKSLRWPVIVDAQDNLGNTPLHLALLNGNMAAVKFLLVRGVCPNLANEKGETPLHIICKRAENSNVIAKNIFAIARKKRRLVLVDARDKLGRTPLQWAVANLLPDTVDVLLNHGANLSRFVFPTEDYFAARLTLWDKNSLLILRLKLASAGLATIERLEKRRYRLSQQDVQKIINVFTKHGVFKTTTDHDKLLNKEVISKAKEIMINLRLSLYELFQLQCNEAAKLLAYENLFNLAYSEQFCKLPEEIIEACLVRLFDIVLKKLSQCRT